MKFKMYEGVVLTADKGVYKKGTRCAIVDISEKYKSYTVDVFDDDHMVDDVIDVYEHEIEKAL